MEIDFLTNDCRMLIFDFRSKILQQSKIVNLQSKINKMNGVEIPYKMLSQDAYSTWLGIEILECEIGRCKVAMTIRKEMLNSMGKAHGGISYSLADTAFGFAANTHGKHAVSIETSINHIEALNEGDYLVAESVIENVKNKLGFNIIEVKRGNELVALFKGVVYRTSKNWEE